MEEKLSTEDFTICSCKQLQFLAYPGDTKRITVGLSGLCREFTVGGTQTIVKLQQILPFLQCNELLQNTINAVKQCYDEILLSVANI